MIFDARLYQGLLAMMFRLLEADRMLARTADGVAVEIASIEEITGLKMDADDEPFTSIAIGRGDHCVGLVGSEPWARVGGPEPYHDSYTVPLYLRDDMSSALEGAVRTVCEALDATLVQVVHAGEQPRAPGVITRVMRFLGLAVG